MSWRWPDQLADEDRPDVQFLLPGEGQSTWPSGRSTSGLEAQITLAGHRGPRRLRQEDRDAQFWIILGDDRRRSS
jgi:hypothetical protein